MKKLTRVEFEKLIEEARVLSKDKHGLKVLKSGDGRIFKIFRLKHAISSARLWPYATRFSQNAQLLSKLGVPTVKVVDAFAVPEMKRDVVVYEPLEGKTLRELIEADAKDCFERLPRFLGELHAKGIFFRSIHFGNIVTRPGGNFGLIDIADMKISHWRGLCGWERTRNFKHLTKYQVDRNALNEFGFDRFLTAYLDNCNVHGIRRRMWKKWIARAVAK